MNNQQDQEWNASLSPEDPDNFWVDDATGEYVCAKTGKRYPDYTTASQGQKA